MRKIVFLVKVLFFIGVFSYPFVSFAANQLVKSFGYYDDAYAGTKTMNFSDQSESFLYFNDSGNSGTLVIDIPMASGSVNLSIIDSSGAEIGVRKTACGSGSCYQVYVESGQQFTINLVDTGYAAGSGYPVFFDLYPDNFMVASDAKWREAALDRIYWPAFSSSIKSLIASNGGMSQTVADIQMMIAFVDMGASFARANPNKPIADSLAAMNSMQKFVVSGAAHENQQFPWQASVSSQVIDALYAGITATVTGNYIDVAQTLIADFSQAAVYGWGVYSTHQLEEKFNAQFITRKILEETIVSEGWLTDDEIESRAYAIAVASDADCSWYSDWFSACGLDNYNAADVIAQYRLSQQLMEDWIGYKKGTSNPYNDVDGDGIANPDDDNPNQPIGTPQPILNSSSDSINVNTLVTFDASESSDPDGTSLTYRWELLSPNGSSASLSSTATETTTLRPDIAGTYTVKLIVNNGYVDATIQKTIRAVAVEDTVIIDDQQIYAEVSLRACELKQILSLTVPPGQMWEKVTFLLPGISSRDTHLIARKNRLPEVDAPSDPQYTCENGYYSDYDGTSYRYSNSTEFHYWTSDLLPGDTLYLALHSGFPVNDVTVRGEIDIFYDADGDGVSDSRDKFPNDPQEAYDSDDDGVGDNADRAPNDPDRTTNSAPSFIPTILQTSFLVGTQTTVSIPCTDTDGDNIHLSLIGSPRFVSLSGNVIIYSPQQNDIGDYSFTIQATDDYGLSALQNLTIYVYEADSALLPPQFTSEISENTVIFSWDLVSGATGYTLKYQPLPYAGEDNFESFPLGNRTSWSYSLPEGSRYAVAVQAYNDNSVSPISNIEDVIIDLSIPLAPPVLSAVTNGLNLALSWNSVPEAEGYFLSYALTETYTGHESFLEYDLRNTTSFSINLRDGDRYTIALQAYKDGEVSDYSNIEDIVINDISGEEDGICQDLFTEAINMDAFSAESEALFAALEEHLTDSWCQAGLSTMYHRGIGVDQDDANAFRYAQLSAQQENPAGQGVLGDSYYNGTGVSRNYNTAKDWYTLSANQGHYLGEYGLGNQYFYSGDYDQAAYWIRLAADQGYDAAQEHLGYLYEFGFGVSQSCDQAIYWYELAAAQGNPRIQTSLGGHYEEGECVLQSYNQAAYWFRLAADQGYDWAQYYLGSLYEFGYGVSQDSSQAIYWYELAAVQGNSNARDALPRVSGSYAGSYSGTFSGGYQGTWQANIDDNGDITGSVNSIQTGYFTVSGNMNDDGTFTMSGSVYGGNGSATFSGSYSNGGLSGSWHSYYESGVFTGQKE